MKKENTNFLKLSGENLETKAPLVTFSQLDLLGERANSKKIFKSDNNSFSANEANPEHIIYVQDNKIKQQRLPADFVPISDYHKHQTQSVSEISVLSYSSKINLEEKHSTPVYKKNNGAFGTLVQEIERLEKRGRSLPKNQKIDPANRSASNEGTIDRNDHSQRLHTPERMLDDSERLNNSSMRKSRQKWSKIDLIKDMESSIRLSVSDDDLTRRSFSKRTTNQMGSINSPQKKHNQNQANGFSKEIETRLKQFITFNSKHNSGARLVPDPLKKTYRLREILEAKCKTHDEFKSLQKFFNRKNFFNVIRDKLKSEKPLNQKQMTLVNDMTNLNFEGIFKEKVVRTDSRARYKSFRIFGRCTYACRKARVKLILKKSQHSSYSSKYSIKKGCFFIFQFIRELLPNYKALEPDGVFRLVWDFMTLIFIFYEMIMVPFTLSFDVNTGVAILAISYLVDCFFILDMVLSFNTGYYSKGNVVKDRRKIARHYLRLWFWLDLIATIPIGWFISTEAQGSSLFSSTGSNEYTSVVKIMRIFGIVRLVRIFKLRRILSKIENYITISRSLTGLLGFVRLAIMILFCGHWIACLWHLVALVDESSAPETWLTQYGIYDNDITNRYVSSIYWATTTMLTVGYGDIVPVTIIEKIVCMVAMLMASVVFGYSMNMVNTLMYQIDEDKIFYRQTMTTLNHYMNMKQVSHDIKIKVKRYLEYTLDYRNTMQMNSDSLMKHLSDQLRNDIIIDINGKLLKSCKLFVDHFTKPILVRTTFLMKERIYSPNEIIIREDIRDNQAICFISQGSVEIYNHYSHSLYEVLERGSHFGEISFFTGARRTANVRSADFSAIFFIPREDFIELLEDHPRDREKFCMIRDRILLENNYQDLEFKCFSCGEKGHTTGHCPELHYCVNKALFLRQKQQELKTFIKTFKRRLVNRNTLTGNYNTIVEAAKFHQNNGPGDLSEMDNSHSNPARSGQLRIPHERSTMKNLSSKTQLDRMEVPNNLIGTRDAIKSMMMMDDVKEQINIMRQAGTDNAGNAPTKVTRSSYISGISEDFSGEFEKVCNFSIYYPHNNITSIIRKMQNLPLPLLHEKPAEIQSKLSKKASKGLPAIKKNRSVFGIIKDWVRKPTVDDNDDDRLRASQGQEESIFLDKSAHVRNVSQEKVVIRNAYVPSNLGQRSDMLSNFSQVNIDLALNRQFSNGMSNDPRNLMINMIAQQQDHFGANRVIRPSYNSLDGVASLKTVKQKSNIYGTEQGGYSNGSALLGEGKKRSTFFERSDQAENKHLRIPTRVHGKQEPNHVHSISDEGTLNKLENSTLQEFDKQLKAINGQPGSGGDREISLSKVDSFTPNNSFGAGGNRPELSETPDVSIDQLLKKMGPDQLMELVKQRSILFFPNGGGTITNH